MASRKEQKEQAREQRLAQEREVKAAAQRKQRLQIIGGIAAIAVIVIVVVVVITSGGSSAPATSNPTTAANKTAQNHVNSILAGIQQPASNKFILGNPNAKVTVTEYGDLECSACDALDTPSGWENASLKEYGEPGTGTLDSLISKYAKGGDVNFVYKSLETATGSGKTPGEWTSQQAAANAAALQGKGWHFIELFYLEQGAEGTTYVNDSFIEGIAKQIPGLDYSKWYSDWKNNPQTTAQVSADNTSGTQLDTPSGQVATPTIYVSGPKHKALFIGNANVANVSAAIEKNLGS